MTELYPFKDPRRRCLPVDEWPERDRSTWQAAMEPGDILDGTVGAGFYWSDQTREKYRKGYGRWLTFLIVNKRLDPGQSPGTQVTLENVRGYIKDLESQDIGSWTLWGRLAELLAAIRVIDLDHEFGWLRQVVRYYGGNTVDRRNKIARLQPADVISGWAMARMEELRVDPPLRDPEVRFRDALMVGLLINCPVRLGNFTSIKISGHLLRSEKGYHLSFEGSETKTGHLISLPVPDILTGALDHYIAKIRPFLLQGTKTDRLWITRYGKPMRDKAIHLAITRTTERAFGKSINPHLFRDCAVTFVAINDPDHVGITAPILGHTDPRATEKHYIQANQIEATRRLRRSIGKLRRNLPDRERYASRRTGA